MFVVSYENKNFTTSFAPFTFNSEEPIVLDTIEYIAI